MHSPTISACARLRVSLIFLIRASGGTVPAAGANARAFFNALWASENSPRRYFDSLRVDSKQRQLKRQLMMCFCQDTLACLMNSQLCCDPLGPPNTCCRSLNSQPAHSPQQVVGWALGLSSCYGSCCILGSLCMVLQSGMCCSPPQQQLALLLRACSAQSS